MNVGEVAVGLRLDDGQVKSSAPQVDRLLARLDQTVTRLAETLDAASGNFEKFGSATQRTAGTVGSTAAAVGKMAGAVGLAALAVRNSSVNVGAAAGAFAKMSQAVKSAWASVKTSTASAAAAVGQSVGKINASVIKPSAASFKTFVGHLLSLSHLAQFGVILAFKTMAKTVGQTITGMSAALGAGIIGGWTAFAATVGKSSVQVAADMEVIHQRLVVLTGSAEKAEEKLAFFGDLAGRSQFKLPQLVDAGTQLEVLGIKAEAVLPLVGDLSGAMGRDIETMSLAVGRALKGIPEGWEMLRNQAGITAEKVAKYGAIINKQGGVDLSSAEAKRKAAVALVGALKETEGSMALKAKGIWGSLAKVSNAVFLLQDAIGQALAPAIKSVSLGLADIINRAAEIVDGLNATKSSILDWVTSLSLGGLALSGWGITIGTIMSTLGGFAASALSLLTTLGLAASVLSLAIGGLAALFPPLAAALLPVAGALSTAATVIGALELAVVAVGLAVGTVLLTAFAAGSAAIAVFSVAWAQNWNGIREKTAAAMTWIQNAVINGFGMVWDKTVETWDAVSRSVSRAAKEIWGALEPVLNSAVDLFQDSWPAMEDIAANALQGVVEACGLVDQVWHGFLRPSLIGLGILWGKVWDDIKRVTIVAWEIIAGIVKSNLVLVRGAVTAACDLIQGDWRGAWLAMAKGISGYGIQIQIAANRVMVAVLREVESFVHLFGLAGEAMGMAIEAGIMRAAGRISNLQSQMSALDSTRGSNRSAWDAVTGFLTGLGQAPKGGGNQPPKSQQESELQKWLREFMDGLGGAADDSSGKTKKQPHKPTEAEIERRNRALLVGSARSLVGRGVAANECMITVRNAARIAGLNLGVARTPFDAAALPPGASVSAGHADSVPGEFFRDRSKVRAGDLAVFQNTDPKYGSGVASHVGIVVEVTRDGQVRMVDASSSRGSVVERSVDEFRPDQQLGFLRPSVFGGSPEAGDFGQLLQDQTRIAEFLQRANDFEKQRLDLESSLREAYEAARKTGATPDVFASLQAEGERRLAEISRHEQESRQGLRDEWLRGALDAAGKDPLLEVLDAVQGLEKTRTDILDRLPGMAEPEGAQAQQILQGLSGVEQFRAMIPALLEGQTGEVDRLMAVLDALPEGNEVRRVFQALRDRQQQALESGLTLETEPEADRWAQTRALADEAMAAIERRRSLQRISVDEEIAAMGQVLNAFQGSQEDKEALIIAQSEREKERLVQRLTLNGEYNQAELEQMEEQLLAKGELLASEEAMLAAVRSARADLDLQEQQAHQQFVSQVEDSFQNFLMQTMSAQQGFANLFRSLWQSLANAVIAEIARMIIKTVAFQAVLKGLSSLLGGIFGGIFHGGGVVGQPLSGAPLPMAHTGGLVVPGGVQTFHGGGLVEVNTRPDEVLAKLQVGEVVLSRRQVREGRRGGAQTVQASPPVINIRELHSHGPQDVVEMARTLGRRAAFYAGGA